MERIRVRDIIAQGFDGVAKKLHKSGRRSVDSPLVTAVRPTVEATPIAQPTAAEINVNIAQPAVSAPDTAPRSNRRRNTSKTAQPAKTPGMDELQLITPKPDLQIQPTRSQRRRDRGPWVLSAGAGIISAAALAIALTRGGGNPNVVYATNSPEPSGAPTGSLNPNTSPSAPAKSENPSVLPFDLKTLMSEMGKIKGDNFALTIDNWTIIYDHSNPGAVMAVDENGQSHLISTLNTSELKTVGQAYWDAQVPGPKDNQAISLVLAPGVTVPVRKITEWPVLPGQTNDQATKIALQGQAALEANTQPEVCTLTITESIQALSENTQDLSNAPAWKPDTSMTADEVAAKYGITGWATMGEHWHLGTDRGWVLDVDPSGANSVVDLPDAVGQAYWDVQNEASNGHQVVAGTLGVGTRAPVRQITLYIGVPKGMEKEVLDYAFKQHVNRELGLFNPKDAQIGVYVVKVPETVCPIERQPGPTSAPTKAEIKTKATAAATEIADTPWYKQFVDTLPENTTSLLPDGGLKIKESSPKNITIPNGYEAVYWNGSEAVTVKGPVIISTAEATIYKIS